MRTSSGLERPMYVTRLSYPKLSSDPYEVATLASQSTDRKGLLLSFIDRLGRARTDTIITQQTLLILSVRHASFVHSTHARAHAQHR